MQYISELITDKTPILHLKNDRSTTTEEKENVLGKIRACLSKKEEYLQMLYLMNNSWYYLKKEEDNPSYPFYLINELMGSYIVKSRGLKTPDYFIAETKKNKGIASLNFKQEGYDYYFGDYFHHRYKELTGGYLILSVDGIADLSILCQSPEKKQKLIDDFINMLAIDTYMLQTDRGPANIQFAVNQKTKEAQLGPIYDFSNCSTAILSSGLFLKNCIVLLVDNNIRLLVQKYPEYKEYLSFLIEQGFVSTWNQICDDYHFNKNNDAYESVLEYYKMKEQSQKNYLSKFIGKKFI